MKKTLAVIGLIIMPITTLLAQQDTTDYYSMSLEELMNIKIVSASKKSESLFDASLSASVLTREEIERAGVTSIPEALRLVPGVIVREQTNGNYDIHIRGLDNMPPNSLLLSSTNTTTLVMINNRPVYNYLQGGTFWESLPIDLNDVDKIEVVRGPSSTLYGPNAVSGVINIITRELEKDQLAAHGTIQRGSQRTFISNASVAYQFTDKLAVRLSGNYQRRGREERYLDIIDNQWVNSVDDLPGANPRSFFPDPKRSMAKYGINAFVDYKPHEKASFHLATGLQNSKVQSSTFDSPIANLSTINTNSRYIDLQASTYGFNTQLAYSTAKQDPVMGMVGSTYDYEVMDASVEYGIQVNSLSIKPSVTYRSAVYDDGEYWDTANGEGTLRGEQTMETLGGGVRLDTRILNEKLRLTGGIRADRFTYPDKWFTSYQFATSYKFNDRHLARVVYSKAYRSPFIFNTFVDYEMVTPIEPYELGMLSRYEVKGNKGLDLLNSNMIEIGYRAKPADNISIDIEAYHTITRNYEAMIQKATVMAAPEEYPVVATTTLEIENIPLEVRQSGVTVSVHAVAGKLQIKPFITLQETSLEDYSKYFNSADAVPGANNGFSPATNNLNSGIGTSADHKFTPNAFGGAYINYDISSKFNFNISAYHFTRHTFYQQENTAADDGVTGVERIQAKTIVNARVGYTPINAITVFVTGKNLFDQNSVEYFRSDLTPRMFLVGATLQF